MRNTTWWLQWTLLAALELAWTLMLLVSNVQELRLIAISGILVVSAIVVVLVKYRVPIRVFWDESTGTMLVFRSWSIEALSARLLSSVPLGIDVSHSATRVLRAMDEHYKKGKNASTGFFVYRPVSRHSTKVGMVCSRKSWITGGKKQAEQLCSQVHEDATIMESAMRASYPHTPVLRAELEDLRMIVSGGTAVNA